MFETKAFFSIKGDDYVEDDIMTLALDKGAENMENVDGYFEITADPRDFETLKKAFDEKEIELLAAEITKLPKTTVKARQGEGKEGSCPHGRVGRAR